MWLDVYTTRSIGPFQTSIYSIIYSSSIYEKYSNPSKSISSSLSESSAVNEDLWDFCELWSSYD